MYFPESNPLLFLAIVGTMGITATALLKVWPGLLAETVSPNAGYVSIAGLRGLLAASVFVHHAAVSRTFFRDGVWSEPRSSLYSFAGTGCVGVFFMITGFLFWGKVLDSKIRFLPLLKSRVRRIMPLYMLSCIIIFYICAYDSNFSISASGFDLLLSIVRWLGGGLFGQPAINGIDTHLINCGVTWTLQYEWVFYLLLPLIAVFSPPMRFVLLISVFFIALLCLKITGYEDEYHSLVVAVPFVGGMLSAYAVRHRSGVDFLSPSLVSAFVITSFALGALAYIPGYFTLVTIGLFPAFAAIALGDDAFGFLKLRWVRFLGEISFSVYLLHGIILMTVLRSIDRVVHVARIPYYGFVLICVGLSATVVLASTTTFMLVERRYMKGGFSKADKP
jgi:peptidoglycan/LPS O-acetylase OafA/YrhL